MNYILALDQATNTTGWSLFQDETLIDFGVAKAEGLENTKIRLMKNWLQKKIQELSLKPDATIQVILEDIQLQHGDVKTFKILAHLQGVLLDVCYGYDIPVTLYYASEWKSSCGVKGKTRAEQKRNAQEYVLNTYNVKAIQDTCDAICLGTHHIKQLHSRISFE